LDWVLSFGVINGELLPFDIVSINNDSLNGFSNGVNNGVELLLTLVVAVLAKLCASRVSFTFNKD
jgi:hypothetical protein